MSTIRILLVDDYGLWHRFFVTILDTRSELQVIGQASDGPEAVQKAQQLQPDLILLDIGLPTLNGIEAARRIRDVSPASKILFVSENRSWDVVKEALNTGAAGYVLKSDASGELLPAVDAVLQGKHFVSTTMRSYDSNTPKDYNNAATMRCHEVAFYTRGSSLVDGFARFIDSALQSKNAVIVVATEAHRTSLLSKLTSDGVNVAAAIEQGSYIPLDVADVLSKLTVNDTPDPVRCAKVIGELMVRAGKGLKLEHRRVVVCGEISPTLLSRGHAEAAIKLEHLWDEITRSRNVQTLCGYLSSEFPNKEKGSIFERICAEHSAVRGLGY